MLNIDRANSSVFCAGENHAGAATPGNAFAERIVCIQNHCSFSTDSFGQRAFFFRDRFPRSHELNVGNANVSDDGGIRRRNFREWRDFARMVHPNFPDRDFIPRCGFQNCAWQSDVIVEVALRFRDAKFST